MKKKMNNKGFSLVELIVVIAIMAILIGVLAPQYLRYVEKTRLQKDNSALAEIANAVKIALADPTINEGTPDQTTITITNASGSVATFDVSDNAKTAIAAPTGSTITTALSTELGNVVGTFDTQSTTYRESTHAIVFTITNDGGAVSIDVDGWCGNVGDDGTGTHTF